SDKTFVSTFEAVLSKEEMISKVGLIATGDSFIAGQEKIDVIKGHFPQVLAVEMEGAAIAQAAQATGKPFVVVRAMSDTAAHDANITFDEFIIEAGKRSAQVLMAFLKAL
ncbi:5'-methylthioadenosine/S-adenosylhomocysteine nucleosidase, partial [Streptococcus agalactiae]